ncbi:MAG: divergent PAP2 family protein, partial [Oscillospiraceae bacterium]
ETGEQAKVLNIMVSDWLDDDDDAFNILHNAKKLKEKVGHTPFEVLGGALLGILIAVIIPVM